MSKTKISWTNETSNPLYAINKETGVRGWACVRVSDGCRNCYAATLNQSQRWGKGTGLDYTVPNIEHVEICLDEKEVVSWASQRKPHKKFVCSMTDMFAEFVPVEFIRKIFWGMALAPNITFQILTKRADRMLSVMNDFASGHLMPFDEDLVNLENVWLGVSVENQKAADERIPLLLQTPAAVRFLSCEPLLGQVHLFEWLSPCGYYCDHSEEYLNAPQFEGLEGWDIWFGGHHPDRSKIDWVIVGGESGPNFRPMNPDWARSIRDQCRDAGVAFWFKQHSGYRPQSDTRLDGVEYHEFPQSHHA